MAKSSVNITVLSEIEFLQENVDHVSVLDQHCARYFDGRSQGGGGGWGGVLLIVAIRGGSARKEYLFQASGI